MSPVTANGPLQLTTEQGDVIEYALLGHDFKIVAFAGTGKTSTLMALSTALQGKRILYIVFNKNQQREAEANIQKLQGTHPALKIAARTAHSIAWNLFGKERFADHQLVGPGKARDTWLDYLQACGVEATTKHSSCALAGAIADAVVKFCSSRDPAISSTHFSPQFSGNEQIVTIAQRLWSEICADGRNALPISHDVYLKAWQLARPTIPWCDVILYDEVQDATPAMLDIVLSQSRPQNIFVGDPHQQLYEFRGAVNAIASIGIAALPLTKTWRFGRNIAALANAILAAKAERRQITTGVSEAGYACVGKPSSPQVILARTNLGMFDHALPLTERKTRLFFRGEARSSGFDLIERRLLAAYALWQGKRANNPVFRFANWEDARLSEVESVRSIVGMVERYRTNIPTVLFTLRDSIVTHEASADVILSTVHGFKGEEASLVSLAADFCPFATETMGSSEAPYGLNEGEGNIAYVAVTRARHQLWLDGAKEALCDSLRVARVPIPAFSTQAPPIEVQASQDLRQWLDVPYNEKDEAKRCGARWDSATKRWYVPPGRDNSALSRWFLDKPPLVLVGEDRTFGGTSLFIDLIPSSCWFTNVRYCVSRGDWDRIRRLVYGRASNRCEVCHSSPFEDGDLLEAHERWHYDLQSRTQRLTRLIALCRACHEVTHFGLAEVRGREESAYAHLMWVNKWTRMRAERHRDQAFDEWRRRNEIDWTLDISLIKDAGVSAKPVDNRDRRDIALRKLADEQE